VTASRHLVLVGLMGAGKTTVGTVCAGKLGRGFVDTDALVETVTGATVPELFATIGEAGFRARERAALADAMASPEPLVVACGGGAMVDPENRRVARGGVVVWLQASPAVLAERVERDGATSRPLIAGGPTVATLSRLADARAESYAAAAHATVSTEGRDADAVAAAVLDRFDELASESSS
jgi:shikimate kinase